MKTLCLILALLTGAWCTVKSQNINTVKKDTTGFKVPTGKNEVCTAESYVNYSPGIMAIRPGTTHTATGCIHVALNSTDSTLPEKMPTDDEKSLVVKQ